VYRAVKIVHRKAFRHERPFERELAGIQVFEPVSRSHQGLIQILGFGINKEQGPFYYIMELGDDRGAGQRIDPLTYSPRTLASEIRLLGKLGFNDCVQLGLSLSLALHRLHAHGLVHRDVKPSNIIFVKGVPKLADIGLLAEMSKSLSYVGTEGFIPPEGPGTPQADIYSLGKVLYEAATGKDRQDFPELPTLLDGLPDRESFLELNEVIVCACTTDLAKRYASAADLHSDFLKLARGESVRRSHQLTQRLGTLRKSAFVIIPLIIGIPLFSTRLHKAWSGAAQPQQNRASVLATGRIDALESGDVLGALPDLISTLQCDQGSAARELQDRLRIGSALSQSAKLEQLWFATNEIAQASFSPDGEKILIIERDGNIHAFHAGSGKPLDWNVHPGRVEDAEFSPDGHCLLTVQEGGIASVWDVESGQRLLKLANSSAIRSARYSPDGARIVTGAINGDARIWDARNGRLSVVIAGHTDALQFAAFSHDGRLVVTAGRDKIARAWNSIDGQSAGPPLRHPQSVNRAAFSPDDETILTVCSDTKARLWEVRTGRKVPSALHHHNGILSAGFSPDGRWIATSMVGGNTRLWRADALSSASWNPVPANSLQVCFDSTARRVLSVGEDGLVRLWNLAACRSRPELATFQLCPNGSRYLVQKARSFWIFDAASGRPSGRAIHCDYPVQRAELNADGRFLITSSARNEQGKCGNPLVQVWNTATGEPIGSGIELTNCLDGVSLSPDGDRLVTFGGTVAQCWTVRTGKGLGPALAHASKISAALFNPNGTRLLIASGSQVHVRDVVSGTPIFPPLEHPAPVAHAEFTADSSRLVTCCSDAEISSRFAQVWNSATGRPIGTPLRHNDGVLFAGFSADGKRVATASEDFTAGIWDAANGRQLYRRCEHEHQVQTARFSPDGAWILTASHDKTARIWSADTGEALTPPFRHTARLSDAKFLADGRSIFTSDVQGRSWVWKLPVEERPLVDLRLIARVLTENSHGQLAPGTEPLPLLLQKLRAKYPREFRVSAAEMEAWHESVARDCETEKQWFAAAFHMQRLLELRPGDAALSDRLEHARQQMHANPRPEMPEADDEDD